MDGGAKPSGRRPATQALTARHGARRTQLILTGLLVALAIAGVRAGPSLHWRSTWRGPWHNDGTAIGVVLELTLAVLLVALLVRGRRSPHPGWPADRLRRTLRVLIILAMLVLAAGLIRLHLHLGGRRREVPHVAFSARPRRAPIPKSHPIGISGEALSAIQYVLLALVVLAVIAALVVLLMRRRRLPAESDDLAPEDDDDEALRTAVAAGRLALTGLTEARVAIIACYVAMERSLGDAGTARAAAETPDELLTRASADGVLHGAAAGTLTALFYQARFSTGPLPAGARDTALRALDGILADLRAGAATRPKEQAGSAAPS